MTLATVAQPQTKLAPQLDERAVAVQQLHKPHALGFGGCPGADCLAFDDVEGIERDAQLETLFSFELRNQRHQRFAQGGRQFVAMRTIAEHDYGPRPSNRSSSCSSTSEMRRPITAGSSAWISPRRRRCKNH